jgi:hypothetical protein
MTSKVAAKPRAAPRAVPVLSKTPVGRRTFVLRLVRDRAVRAAHPATPSKP